MSGDPYQPPEPVRLGVVFTAALWFAVIGLALLLGAAAARELAAFIHWLGAL